MNYRPSEGDALDPESTPSTVDHVRRFGPPALIGIAALLFVFQNTDRTPFEFLWFDFELPLWIILLGFSVVGAIVFWAVARRRRRRRLAAND